MIEVNEWYRLWKHTLDGLDYGWHLQWEDDETIHITGTWDDIFDMILSITDHHKKILESDSHCVIFEKRSDEYICISKDDFLLRYREHCKVCGYDSDL
jgi:hypothetical protein